MKETLDFLKEVGTFYLATVDGDQPHVRPFGAVNEFDGKIYLITALEKDVFKQIEKNPKVEISGTTQDGRWLRLNATLVRDDNAEAKKSMLDANPNLRAMYSEDDGKSVVLYLKDATSTICSFTAAPVTYNF